MYILQYTFWCTTQSTQYAFKYLHYKMDSCSRLVCFSCCSHRRRCNVLEHYNISLQHVLYNIITQYYYIKILKYYLKIHKKNQWALSGLNNEFVITNEMCFGEPESLHSLFTVITYLTFSLVAHMRWPETHSIWNNEVTELVISGI